MKLLVFSDTHNSASRMLDIAEQEQNVAACLFLGDGSRDADKLQEAQPNLPLYRVQGNCDFSSQDPEEGLAPFGGLLFFYVHGHKFDVKTGITQLWQAAQKRGADVALFGHTHIPYYELVNGIHLFNPGSLNLPRAGKGTYGVIQIENATPHFEIRSF